MASLRRLEWESMQPNFFIILSPAALRDLPATYMTSFFLPQEEKRFLNRLLSEFPTITVIEIDAIVEQIQSIVDRVTQAVELVLALVVASGCLVLIASIQASRDARMREHALVRTLGGGRSLIRGSLAAEFAVLGAFSGLVAVVGAEVTVALLQSQIFELPANAHPWLWLLGPIVGAGLILAVGLVWHPPPGVLAADAGSAGHAMMTDASCEGQAPIERAASRGGVGVMQRMVLALLILAGLGSAQWTVAEVRLSTTIHRVDGWIEEEGELEAELADAALVAPGDELRYTIAFTNTGLVPVDPGAIVITNPIPESTEYVWDSAGGADVRILYHASAPAETPLDDTPEEEAFVPLDELVVTEGELVRSAAAAEVRAVRWIYEAFLPPGESSEVWFHVRLQ